PKSKSKRWPLIIAGGLLHLSAIILLVWWLTHRNSTRTTNPEPGPDGKQTATTDPETSKPKPEDTNTAPPPNTSQTFSLQAKPTITLTPGGATNLRVSVTREGYDGRILLGLSGLPVGVTAKPTEIPARQRAVDIELTAADDTPVGTHNVQVRATGGSQPVD